MYLGMLGRLDSGLSSTSESPRDLKDIPTDCDGARLAGVRYFASQGPEHTQTRLFSPRSSCGALSKALAP